MSEFRGTPASQSLAATLQAGDYPHQLSTTDAKRPAINSLLLASRYPLKHLRRADQWYQPKVARRWLLAEVETATPFTIGLMHIPNYTSPEKYPYLNTVLRMIEKWRLGPALIGGDTNCGKMLLDEEGANPKLFQREHDWMEGIEARGWSDAFRQLHGERREFTWYSHRENGFRLDHAFLNPSFAPSLAQVQHIWGHDPQQPERRDALSDHAALILDFSTELNRLQML